MATRSCAAVAAALAGIVAIVGQGAAKAAPGPEYEYRLLYELTRTEFQRVNRLCGIAFNNAGHAAWIRNGIVNPDGTSDINVRQLWFHDGTRARLLWSSTAANWVAGQDEYYPDCSGTSNVGGGSTVALNDDDLLMVLVGARSGAPSAQPGQNPPEFFWIDAAQDPASVLRTGQSASSSNFPSYGRGIILNNQGQVGFHAVTNGGTSNAGWLLTATNGLTSQSGGFPSLESNWAAATLVNDAGWVASSFGRGSGCPAGAGCTVLLSVLDTTRNDALRLREVVVGPGSAWMGAARPRIQQPRPRVHPGRREPGRLLRATPVGLRRRSRPGGTPGRRGRHADSDARAGQLLEHAGHRHGDERLESPRLRCGYRGRRNQRRAHLAGGRERQSVPARDPRMEW